MATRDNRLWVLAQKFAQLKISYPLFDEGDPGKEASNGLLALNENDNLARELAFCCSEACGRSESVLDLVVSPGPKFLARMWQLESADGPLPPFKASAAVPFQWEEIPGKPKPYHPPRVDGKHSLKLPPRLAVNSCGKDLETVANTMNSTKQTPLSSKQATNSTLQELNTKTLSRPAGHSSALSLRLPSAFKSFLSKSFKVGLLKPSYLFTKYKVSSHLQVCARSEYHMHPTYNVRSLRKFFVFGRWQRGQKFHKVRGLSEIEIWGPSLDTYFKCMELSDGRFGNLECSESPVSHLLEGVPSLKANKLEYGDNMTSK
ncbi:hypothetical protein O6H91_14G048200 [Diphasiastrum complanatum]|uniref:Uncharacterized protein n=1 Tax=Diphasiastrum complanatum TaxID=34168 RepID=A0ACC2BP18_DIPCM|nr:hypothetical protein O6H91_Y038200 [Diphasiastrum complanatum]KAJ7531538.1 hypothetical protein O6H91_14G048200 [Diphasiastrum complanatum]